MTTTITRKFTPTSKTTLTAYPAGEGRTRGVCIHIRTICGYTGQTETEMCLTKAEAAELIQELQALVTG